MKRLKLFAFLLVALPSVSLGMEQLHNEAEEKQCLIPCDGEDYDIASIDGVELRQRLIAFVQHNYLKGPHIVAIVERNKKSPLLSFQTVYDEIKKKLVKLTAIFQGEHQPNNSIYSIVCIMPLLDIVTCDGRDYNIAPVGNGDHQEKLREFIDRGIIKSRHLDYILDEQRVDLIMGVNPTYRDPKSPQELIKLEVEFRNWDAADVYYTIFEKPKPLYLNKKLWAAAAFVGLGYYYRHTIANGMHNFLSGLRNARSFIAQEAAPRVNAFFGRVKNKF
jgi:hypothetical protein